LIRQRAALTDLQKLRSRRIGATSHYGAQRCFIAISALFVEPRVEVDRDEAPIRKTSRLARQLNSVALDAHES